MCHFRMLFGLFALIFWSDATPDITLLVKKETTDFNLTCVATGNETLKYALTWIPQDILAELEPPISTFLQSTIKQAFVEELKTVSSLEYKLPPVFDERWNAFRTFTSTSKQPIQLLDRVQNSILHFSVQFQFPLCLQFQFDGNTLCAYLRKSENAGNFEDCECNFLKLSNTNETWINWKHYSLFKDSDRFKFQEIKPGLELESEVFAIEDVRGFSESFARWKVHNYDFRRGILLQNEVPLSLYKDSITLDMRDICLSFNLFVEKQCKIILAVDTEDTTTMKVILGDDFQWQEVDLMNVTKEKEITDISLSVDKSSAIGNCTVGVGYIRHCNINDIRIITRRSPNTHVGCMSLADNNHMVTYNRISADTKQINTRSKFIGANRNISCTSVSNTLFCNNSAICHESNCYCPNGFTGEWCEIGCNKVGFWGPHCQTSCGTNCLNQQCDTFTGACVGCIVGFKGAKCRQQLFSIDITNINSNSIVFVTKNISDDSIVYADLSDDCANGPSSKEIIAKNNMIYNLEAYTNYTVCYSDNKDTKNTLITKFTTKCKGLEIGNLKITPHSLNITIQVSINKNSCPVDEYTWYVKEIGEKRKLENKNMAVGLLAYTNYTLVFVTNISSNYLLGDTTFTNTIRTMADRPVKVQGIKVIERKFNSLTIEIEDPNKLNTIFKGYHISYKIRKYEACTDQTTDEYKTICSMQSNLTLIDLNPYTSYEIKVSAENKIGIGPPQIDVGSTLPADYITSEEYLKIMKPSKNMLVFVPPNCSTMKGPITYRFTYSCIEKWCQNITINHTANFSVPYSKLTPFTMYNLTIISQRDSTKSSYDNPTIMFITPPQKPNRVRNFEAYAQNNRSIWLRWKVPYPPTGDPEIYLIKYCNSRDCLYANASSGNKCKIWADYICGYLVNLTTDANYNISIKAKNFDVNELGMDENCAVVTKETASSPPIVHLEFHGNVVNIQWSHPFTPNGNLTFFSIIAEESENFMNDTLNTIVVNQTISEMKMNYSYALKQLKPGAVYTIFVQGFSSQPGNRSEGNTITTPLPVPVISGAPTLISENTGLRKILLPNVGHVGKNSSLYVVFVDKNKLEDKINIQKGRAGSETYLNCINKLNIGNYSKKIAYIGNVNTTIEIPKDAFDVNWNDNRIYDIHVVIENKYKQHQECVGIMAVKDETADFNQNNLYFLFLLLLIPIGMVAIFIIQRNGICGDRISRIKSRLRTFQAEEMEELYSMPPSENDFENKAILKTALSAYIRQLVTEDEIIKLEDEYSDINLHSNASQSIGKSTLNKPKNRFENVCPYDNCRVILIGDPACSYINASYIKGRNGDRTYIATQCPKETTAYDFWRMVLQERVSTIVCLATLAEGTKKMYKYWQDQYEKSTYDDIEIDNQYTNICTDFYINNIKVTRGDDERYVTQYCYITWPDQTVPIFPLSLLNFIKNMKDDRKPIIVHCSAGIGRTGSYIMCDELIRQTNTFINIPQYLHTIRQCRPNLVAKLVQYKLIYFILDEAFNADNTALDQTEFIKNFNSINFLEIMESIENRSYMYRLQYDYIRHSSYSADKHRIATVIPNDGIVYLPRYPSNDISSDYINAYFMNGYETSDKYLATQHPLPSTVGDFWRLIDDKKIENIIILQNIIPGEHKFWPTTNTLMTPVDFLQISMVKKYKDDDINFYVLDVLNTTTKKTHKTTIMLYTAWLALSPIPINVKSFYYFYNTYVKSSLCFQDSPVLLCCHDSASGCGLFVTAELVLCKLFRENIFDIYWAVQSNRHRQKHLMNHQDQFRFIAELAKWDLENRTQGLYQNGSVLDRETLKKIDNLRRQYRGANVVYENLINSRQ